MTPLETVTAALEAHGHTVRNGSARCPAHDDRSPSLTVAEGQGGAALVCCHAGCPTEAVVTAVGLSMADLFADERTESRRRVATYRYVDETGELLYEVVRFDPKDFRQRRPDGRGGYVWNLNGTRRVPYRLPEVLNAVALGRPVFVVEGEKDADALARAGHVATCNPQGAGKWSKVPDAPQLLDGAGLVVVVADMDDAGRAHARQVAASLLGRPGPVIVVEAAKGKDAADHLGAGLGVEDFEVVAGTRPDDPPLRAWLAHDEPRHDNPSPDVDELPRPLDWHTLFARTVDEEEWLVDDLWPARRAISVVARYKSGKSLLLFYVLACLARGIDPWTARPRPPITVGYWDMEMTEDDVHERAVDFGLQPDDLDRFRYYLLPNVAPLDTPEGGRAVLDTLRRDGVQAVVFDTFGRVLEGEENLADTIAAYNRWTAIHLKAEGIASARLDHVGHTNQERARGTSSKGADVDVAWMLTRGDGNALRLDHHGVSRLRWVPRTLDLTLIEGPPDRYGRAEMIWPAGTQQCAELLNRLGVPLDCGRGKARKALAAHGEGVRNDVLGAALRYRNDRENLSPIAGDRS